MEKLCQISECGNTGIITYEGYWICSKHLNEYSKNVELMEGLEEKSAKEIKEVHLNENFKNFELMKRLDKETAEIIKEKKENNIKIFSNKFLADTEDLYGCQLCNYYDSGYFIRLKRENGVLPQDYQDEIRLKTNEFSNKIFDLSEKNEAIIKELSILYMNSLQKLICNIQIPEHSIYSLAFEIYLQNRSQIDEIFLDCLIKLLDTARQVLKMRSTVHRIIQKNICLEEEIGSFLSRYVEIRSFDIKSLITDFFKTFSCFIENNKQDHLDLFQDFENSFNSQKQNCIKKNQNTLYSKLLEIIATLEFETLEISYLSAKNVFEAPQHNTEINATPISTIQAIRSQCSLGEIVVIYQTKMLIPIYFDNFSVIIFTTESRARIALKLFSVNLKIAQGSTEDSLLIFQNYPRSVFIYRLNDNKFEVINRSIDLAIEAHLNIEYLIYIQELDKAIYVTSSKGVFSKILNCSIRAKHNITLDDNFSMNFCQNLKRIFFVEVTKVMMFNIYMGSVAVIQVIASPDRVLEIGEQGFVVGGSLIRVKLVDETRKTVQEPPRFIQLDQRPWYS